MRKGLTPNIEAIIEKVAAMETITPYILTGGTALAMQIGHRKSEDLDFMMWRKTKIVNRKSTGPLLNVNCRKKLERSKASICWASIRSNS